MAATRTEGGGGGGAYEASKPVRKAMKKSAPTRKRYAEGHANGHLPAKYVAERRAAAAALNPAPKPGYSTKKVAGGITAAMTTPASWINPTGGKKNHWP